MIGNRQVFIALFAAILFFASTSAASAATIYANSSTGNDTTGNGSSGNPYKTFTKAYTAASAGDTINLTGTFTWTDPGETGDAATTGYTISKNLTITGQGADQTIIQAASTTNTANSRVFTIASGVTATTSNLTIRYGKVGSSEYGGGILVAGTAIISACDISYNSAEDGGGVDVEGTATIENSTIHNNTAVYMGGGLNRDYYDASGGTPTSAETMDIINSTISNNTVTSSVAYMEGGGVFYRRGYGSVTNSTIAYNQVSGDTQSSTQGIGTGNGAGTIYLKNNIIADNIYSTYGGDIGERESGDGTFVDNGSNIIGRVGYYSGNYTPASTTWLDAANNSASLDGTFVENDGTGTHSGPLGLSSTLASNGTTLGTQTLALSSGSIAISNGISGTNGSISVPTTDQRGGTRGSPPGIGAYEYGAIADTIPPSVSMTSPTASEATSSVMTLAATASDNFAVAGVTFYVNGTKEGVEDTSSPYSVSFDTTATSSGTYTAFAVARDTSNNYATSSSVSFTIDNTPPSVSLIAPTSGESTSSTMTLAATASDANTSVAGVKFYVDGVMQGSEITSAPYAMSWNTTATSSGSYSAFAVARDTVGNHATSTSVSFTISNIGPTPTLVSASTTSSGAVITWTTATTSSSRAYFGLDTSYGTSTAETDTSVRVSSHTVTISELPPCTQFHYEVVSRNAVLDAATSSDHTFDTTGCTGNASIVSTGQSAITTGGGGSVSQGNLTLTVPVSFTSTSTSATFQANQLDGTTFFAAAGAPAGMDAAGNTVFDIKALTDATTTLSSFSSPLTVKLSYSPADISGLVESSLEIYRYDSWTWTALSGCMVDTSAHTVTCETSNFSDFAIFGEVQSSPSPSVSTTGGGGIVGCYGVVNKPGSTACSGALAVIVPQVQVVSTTPSIQPADTSSTTVVATAPYRFTRWLKQGMSGIDVRQLQEFLNAHGFLLASTGPGSSGDETTYFGTLTKAALITFQEAHSIRILAPEGLTKGTGFFGPMTIAFINTALTNAK